MKKHILGVSRDPKFSPGSVDRDAAIFAAVMGRLLRYTRNEVSVISEDLFISVDLSEFDMVCSMARSEAVLKDLAKAQLETGLKVVNDAQKLLSLNRLNLTRLMTEAQVPQPAYQAVVWTEEALLTEEGRASAIDQTVQLMSAIPFPLWVKRADACAQEKGDVCYVESASALRENLQRFTSKGCRSVVAFAHETGDLIKFYGVGKTDFFEWSYPQEKDGFSKFGLEQYNAPLQHYPFDANLLKTYAGNVSECSGLTVYGGDAIVRPDGSIVLIDFNDWPSFSSCRKAAAKAIAQAAMQLLAEEEP